MSEAAWVEVSRNFAAMPVADDEVLRSVRASCEAAGRPVYLTPAQGKLLSLLTEGQKAKRVLEIGTRGGYGTIWLARGLAPGGCLITLESNSDHARLARDNLAASGLAARVMLREGDLRQALSDLREGPKDPFDLIFVNADKPSYPDYLAEAIKLSRSGTIIVAEASRRENGDEAGLRLFNRALGTDPRLSTTHMHALAQASGDALAFALVTADP